METLVGGRLLFHSTSISLAVEISEAVENGGRTDLAAILELTVQSRLRGMSLARILWMERLNKVTTSDFAAAHRDRRCEERPCIRRVALSSLMLCVASGCFSPLHSRMPMVWSGFPSSESLAYQQQDPFPDPDIGPDTMSRPPGFDRPRTAARKAAEQKLLQGLSNDPEAIPPGNPRGAGSHPRSVN